MSTQRGEGQLVDNHQWIAKRLLIFGLHVHVGMRDGEHAIRMSNALLSYLPILLAFSCSSPFVKSEDTCLASSRITYFEASPTGGHPYEVRDWNEFNALYARLVKSGSIRSPKDLWWDIRPSPAFGTLELRIFDSPATLKETVAIVALIHLLCQHMDQRLERGEACARVPDWAFRENKWRASRFGLAAHLITDFTGTTQPLHALFENLVSSMSDLIAENGYENHIHVLRRVLIYGNSSDRQRRIYEGSGRDLHAVTRSLIHELEMDQPQWGESANIQMPNQGGKECA